MAEKTSDGREIRDGKEYLTADGATYEVTPLEATDDNYDVIVGIYKDAQISPLQAVIPDVEKLEGKPQMQERILRQAMEALQSRPEPTPDQIGRWMQTAAGQTALYFHLMRPNYPNMTLELTKKILFKVGKAERLKTVAVQENGQAHKDVPSVVEPAPAQPVEQPQG